MDTLTTFSDRRGFERVVALLTRLGAAHEAVSPDPGYAVVASPALVLAAEARAAFVEGSGARVPEDVVGAWASLERVRRLANDVWSCRTEITPSFELRRRPPALEIHRRLPGTNCGLCGESARTAFSRTVWRGDADPRSFVPVFQGERAGPRDALLAICAGTGAALRT